MTWRALPDPTKSVKTQWVTLQLAKEFSLLCDPPVLLEVRGERMWKQARIDMLMEAIRADRKLVFQWAVCTCLENGLTYRENGKHSSRAMVDMYALAPDLLKDVQVSITHYLADTMDDVVDLHSAFDLRASLRTTHDINITHLRKNARLDSVKPYVMDRVTPAIASVVYGERYLVMAAPSERAALAVSKPGFLKWVQRIFDVTPHKKRFVVPVVAGMYQAYKKSAADANTFYLEVAAALGKTSTARTPVNCLAKFLATHHVTTGRGKNGDGATPREYQYVTLAAWNAWRTGQRPAMRYTESTPLPRAV